MMGKANEFHGWTVEADEARNRVTLVKEHPAGKNGRLVVTATGGNGTPHEIVRASAERDALAEDVRLAPPDDVEALTERHAKASAAVKVLRESSRETAGKGQ